MDREQDRKQLRVRTAEAFASAMRDAGIRFITMSGLYGYPDAVGRDLDLLIRRKDTRRAIAIAEQVRERFGWDKLLVRWLAYNVWEMFFIRKDADELCWLEIDLMHEDAILLGAAPLILNFEAMVDTVDSYCGPFPLNKIGYYIKAQLRPILYGDFKRFGTKYELEPVDDPDLQEYLRRLMGQRTGDQFIAATHAGIDRLAKKRKSFKWAVNRTFALRHPLGVIRNYFWSRILRPWQLYWQSSGLVLAVVWPRGQNQDMVLEQAVRYFNGCFQVKRREVRAYELSTYREPRVHRTAFGLGQWWRIISHIVCLNFTYFAQDRFLPKSVIQFVLYRGSPADLVVNPCCYGIKEGIRTQLLRRLSPRPVEIVVLSGDQDNVGALRTCDCRHEVAWATVAAREGLRLLTPACSGTVSAAEVAQAILEEIETIYAAPA